MSIFLATVILQRNTSLHQIHFKPGHRRDVHVWMKGLTFTTLEKETGKQMTEFHLP